MNQTEPLRMPGGIHAGEEITKLPRDYLFYLYERRGERRKGPIYDFCREHWQEIKAAWQAADAAFRAEQVQAPTQQQLMPFGHHRGRPINEVPPNYIRWMMREIKEEGLREWRIWEAVNKRWQEVQTETNKVIDEPEPTPELTPEQEKFYGRIRHFLSHVERDFHYPTTVKIVKSPDGEGFVGVSVKHPGGVTLVYLVHLFGDGTVYPASEKDGKISYETSIGSQNIFDVQYDEPAIEIHTFETRA
jgi:uncharacterized protein (DUF3820 family)